MSNCQIKVTKVLRFTFGEFCLDKRKFPCTLVDGVLLRAMTHRGAVSLEDGDWIVYYDDDQCDVVSDQDFIRGVSHMRRKPKS